MIFLKSAISRTLMASLSSVDDGAHESRCGEPCAIASPPSSVDERITAVLAGANRAAPIAELRAICRLRNITLYERLTAMTDAGHLVRSSEGYLLSTVV